MSLNPQRALSPREIDNILDEIEINERRFEEIRRNSFGKQGCGILPLMMETNACGELQYRSNNCSYRMTLKHIDQVTFDIINGYIKNTEAILPNRTYYNIPAMVNHICALFYYETDEWDKNSIKKRQIKVHNNIATERRTQFGTMWDTIFMKNVVFEGKNYWTFRLIQGSGWPMRIGVWKRKYGHVIPYDYIGERAHHAYVHDVCYARLNIADKDDEWTEDESYGVYAQADAYITMCLDFQSLTLSFAINGIDFGAAFTNIEPCAYKAAVSLSMRDSSIEFVSYKKTYA